MKITKCSELSLSWTRKGPENLFEVERVRDRERKIGYSLHKGTENLVRDRERFEIESVRDREGQLDFEISGTEIANHTPWEPPYRYYY